MPDASGGHDPAPLDELDRELRELTEGRAGEPLFLEPSAAERARAGGVRVKAAQIEAAPVAAAGPRVSRRRRASGRRLLGSLLAVTLLLLAGGLAWGFGKTASARSGERTPASDAGLAAALGTISPGTLFDGPPADPFLGTQADGWADGAAGIVAPAARPAGGFTAAQVAAAYATTRQLLIAAALDRQTLLGGPPAAFARLLTAPQRETFLAGLDKRGVAKDGYPLSTRTWVTSFAPGTAALVGTVIKVHGTMTARAVTESGTAVLAVEVNYLVAYAVKPPHDPADWTRVVSHLSGSVDFARWDDPGGALEPRDRTVVETAGLGCGASAGYIYPDYPSDQWTDSAQSGPVIGPYSPGSAAAPGGAAAACAPGAGR